MLRWFRSRARTVASAVLIAFVALGGVSAAAHGSDCHEEECGVAIRHDASEHALEAPSSASAAPLHCVVCHWSRSTRPSPEVVQHLAPRGDTPVRLYVEAPRAISSSYTPQPPLRSPPAPALNA